MARNLYQTVTDQIVAKLEAGTAPWVKPWSQVGGTAIPCNAITNRPYSGINVLLFWISQNHGWSSARFLTFNQAKNAGGSVRKGEKSKVNVYFFSKIQGKDKKSGEDKEFFILKSWAMFNVDQCEGLSDAVRLGRHADVAPKNKTEREETADDFIKSSGADFREGTGSPAYIPSRDFITVPAWEAFHGKHEFYGTAFHELAHWTGHKSRLDRDLSTRFGTSQYAAEELVAEITASFLCAEYGFDTVDNSAAYLKSWIEILKNDPKAIFTAASKAQAAADYLRGKALAEEDKIEVLEAA